MKWRLEQFRMVGFVVAVVGLAGLTHSASAIAGPCPNEARRIEQGSTYLPECRAFEQVSPVEKGEHDAVPMGREQAFPAQAAPSGQALGFMSASPLAGAQKGGTLVVPSVAERGENGWEIEDVGSPTPQRTPTGAFFSWFSFSPDLSRVTFTAPLQQLVSGAPADVVNLYTLDRSSGSYALLTSAPPLEPVPPGCIECFKVRDFPAFLGASADNRHSIFNVNEGLVPGVPKGGGVNSLYENVDGEVRLAGVLPDGSIPAEGSAAGAAGQGLVASEPYFFFPGILADALPTPSLTGQVENAISEDGTRIIFAANADALPNPGQAGTVQLYDRVEGASEGVTGIEGSSTLELSKPAVDAPVGAAPGPARFWAASPDGSHVLFTSRQELTGESNTGPEASGSDLYMATVESVAGETSRTSLVDLTLDPEAEGARVLGVVGASRDLDYVYFVAQGKLPGAAPNTAGSEAVDGEPNLYLAHDGTVDYIATLAPRPPEEPERPGEASEEASGESGRVRPGDENDWTPQASTSQAYVTPDGRHLAFMSLNSLTGVPNNGKRTGRRVSEVFEYSADDRGLVCASCSAEGDRPIGNAYLGARDNATGNTPPELTLEGVGGPLHRPRYMNSSGSELFFTSPDPGLLSPSVGETTPDSHARVFVYANGHASLISAPDSSLGEEFLDASESGDDVFIATRNRLDPGDDDSNGDVYDVRVNGGFPVAGPSVCGGESECRGETAGPGVAPPSLTSEMTGASGNQPPHPKKKATRTPSARRKLKKELAKCNHRPAAKRARCKAGVRQRHRERGQPKKGSKAHKTNDRRAH